MESPARQAETDQVDFDFQAAFRASFSIALYNFNRHPQQGLDSNKERPVLSLACGNALSIDDQKRAVDV